MKTIRSLIVMLVVLFFASTALAQPTGIPSYIIDRTIPRAIAAGTADAITADFNPNIKLKDKLVVIVEAKTANATTTTSFSPDGLTARTIVKYGGSALVAGDISAEHAVILLAYNVAHTRWELLNPATSSVTAASLHMDDILTVLGVSSEATHLGTFTGSTIADNQTVKAALQALETSLELKAPSTNIALTALAAQAAQSVNANATDGAAAPTAVAIGASQIVARLAAGNVKGASTTEMKTLLGYYTSGDSPTFAAVTVSPSAAPTILISDSDALGADKEIGKIVGAYIDGADGAENGTVSIYAHEAGTTTEYIQADGKNGVVDVFKPLIVASTIQGRAKFLSYDAAQTLTAAVHNGALVRLTVAGEITLWDCETANVGDFITLWARDAEKIEVVPASGDQFFLFDGTGITADDELDMAATAGTKVTLMCTADDSWSVITETAACADGGAAD